MKNRDATAGVIVFSAQEKAPIAVPPQLYAPGEGGGVEAALALVEEGQRSLSCHSAIKSCRTAAQSQITSAAGQVHALVEQRDDILRQITSKLRQ